MYTHFRIQNFKSFRDLAFDDLARVNLIAGKNNTGKTSVLEAIALHSGLLGVSFLNRVNNSPSKPQHIPLLVLFHNLDKTKTVTFDDMKQFLTLLADATTTI